jgi:NAD(P)-dependent dehydrogenase (short-subunit alcohol dehydrogenase family)
MDLHLTNRRAIVTGGSRGIGLAAARALAGEGANVALVARDPDALSRAAEQLAADTGRTVIAVPADTGRDESVAAMVDEVVERLGGVDVLVNCAARPNRGNIGDDALEDEVNVKVRGYLRCVRAAVPHMLRNDPPARGAIVNIAGVAALRTGSLVGTIRNVAVAAMTKNLADELGPQGITVNVVHPGFTITESTPQLLEGMAAARGVTTAEAEQGLKAGVSVGRLMTADEVAAVIAFLASPVSVAVNGDPVLAAGGVKGWVSY